MCLDERRTYYRVRLVRGQVPLRNSARQLRVALVADKGPAFLVYDVVVCMRRATFDQGFGVFEVAVDGLNGCCNSVFLLKD